MYLQVQPGYIYTNNPAATIGTGFWCFHAEVCVTVWTGHDDKLKLDHRKGFWRPLLVRNWNFWLKYKKIVNPFHICLCEIFVHLQKVMFYLYLCLLYLLYCSVKWKWFFDLYFPLHFSVVSLRAASRKSLCHLWSLLRVKSFGQSSAGDHGGPARWLLTPYKESITERKVGLEHCWLTVITQACAW